MKLSELPIETLDEFVHGLIELVGPRPPILSMSRAESETIKTATDEHGFSQIRG
jgi:fructoselysine-6-P-deglycase FrlB-like protein